MILFVLNTKLENMTMSEGNVIEMTRPAPNPLYMQQDASRVINLLVGVEALCDSGPAHIDAIRALTLEAVKILGDLKTDIERMMK